MCYDVTADSVPVSVSMLVSYAMCKCLGVHCIWISHFGCLVPLYLKNYQFYARKRQ